MNDITRQSLIMAFFAFLIIWKLADILLWLIIKFSSWNTGVVSIFLFCIFIFYIRYKAYKRKIEAQK